MVVLAPTTTLTPTSRRRITTEHKKGDRIERMKEPVHDWRTIREHWREDGRLQVERCRSRDAGRITIADHEAGAASIITTNPDPMPTSCPMAVRSP